MGGNFDQLEHAFDGHLADYASGKITDEELSRKFSIFSKGANEAQYRAWIDRYPRSYAARLARGISRIGEAWNRRGTGYRSETSDEQYKEFAAELREAQSDLRASLNLSEKPVLSYSELIKIEMGFGHGADRKLLDAALALDPKAVAPRDAYFFALTPKWGGSLEAMTSFMDECEQAPIEAKYKKGLSLRYLANVADIAHTARDFKAASEIYLRAYHLAHSSDLLRWSAIEAKSAGDLDLAFARYDELAKTFPKVVYGFTQRGYLYETYLKNDAMAFKDYVAASELGDAWAQNRVGWWYMTGRYVSKDYAKAEAYFTKASAQKAQDAVANLHTLWKLRDMEPRWELNPLVARLPLGVGSVLLLGYGLWRRRKSSSRT